MNACPTIMILTELNTTKMYRISNQEIIFLLIFLFEEIKPPTKLSPVAGKRTGPSGGTYYNM